MKHRIITLAFLLAGLASSPADEVSEAVATHSATAPATEHDAATLALTNAFRSTASAIREFNASKAPILNNRARLKSALRNIVLDLEPAYDTWNKQIGPDQEAAAIQILRQNEALKPYANTVERLWKGVLKSRPLSERFIAKVVAPDVCPFLEEDDAPPPVEGGATILVLGILLGAVIIVSGGVYLGLSRKKHLKEEMARRRELEEQEKRKAEEAAKPEVEQIEEQSTYNVTDLVMSGDLKVDLRNPLHKPERHEPDKKYTLIVYLNGKMHQRFDMTKPVISFGRRSKVPSNDSVPDITFDIDGNQGISRFHGILYYESGEDSSGEEYSFWMLALTQRETPSFPGDAPMPQQTIARIIRSKEREDRGRAFPIEAKEKVFLSDSVSIIIE